MTGEVRKCANPQCGNTFTPNRGPGGARRYCSVKCRTATANARHRNASSGRSYPPPKLIKTRRQQLAAYFDLLMRLAQRFDGEEQRGLFDRIERTIAEIEKEDASRCPTPCGVGWPS